MTSIQRTIKYAAMGFAVLLTLFIVSVIFEVITGIFGDAFGDEKTVSGKYEFTGVTSVSADLGIGDLIIKTEGDKFIVKADKVYGFDARVKNGKLIVESGSISFGKSMGDAAIEIILPEGFEVDKLDLELGVGKAEVRDLVCDRANIDMGTGSILTKNFDANYCKVDSGIGEVELNFSDAKENYELVLDKGIGSVSVDGEDYDEDDFDKSNADKKIDIDCGIGEVKVSFK